MAELVQQCLEQFLDGYKKTGLVRRPSGKGVNIRDAATGELLARFRYVTKDGADTLFVYDPVVLYLVPSAQTIPLQQGALPQPYISDRGLDEEYDLGTKVSEAFAAQDAEITDSRRPVKDGAALIAELQAVTASDSLDGVTTLYERLNALPGVEYVVNAAGLVNAAKDIAARLADLETQSFLCTGDAREVFESIAGNKEFEAVGKWKGVLDASLAARLRLCGLARYDYQKKELKD